jgi:hypothetical protein
MLADTSNQLNQVIEQRRHKQKLEQDLRQVERSLEVKSELLDRLEQQLKKEQVDVEQLERLSLTSIFYSILGSRDQQEEKERQEVLAAQLKYEQAKRLVDALRVDQAQLEAQLHEMRGVDDDYASLLAAKERLLRQANPQIAEQLIRLSEQIANHNAEKREIDEAMAAATDVLASLDQVNSALESAEGWGTWDMLGGGLLSTAIKHSRIDEAREAVHTAQAKMSRFTRELADVQRSTDLKIEIGGLDTFADFFFDGLIVDWIVQSKIQNSLQQSRLAGKRIAKTVEDLGALRVKVLSQAQSLNAQRAAIIEQA